MTCHGKNEVSWNAMIVGLASHGKAKEALSLFQCMLDEGCGACPNDITFVALLSACVHAGLVDEGYRLFDMMSTLFGLVPKIEHYSCMVDLLARAGHLYEAWDLIEKMPEKPDKVTLGALHGACQRLKNVDIGERVGSFKFWELYHLIKNICKFENVGRFSKDEIVDETKGLHNSSL
ncbi:hypothetical protein Ahy_B06g086068 [Arachis hypogaea]|uniref:Pentatricopeptide repeat-containing protein n=1 Tax=Arachis hypogaea TaxID=3818 RepID=A0A444YWL2_ARAHY|nr:hypothetical protein Ahy_B06g086068 [Arachis hypogaea]